MGWGGWGRSERDRERLQEDRSESEQLVRGEQMKASPEDNSSDLLRTHESYCGKATACARSLRHHKGATHSRSTRMLE